MATSVHECTFALELQHGSYLSGSYVCTQCGAHASVHRAMRVSEFLLWQEQLGLVITKQDAQLKKLYDGLRVKSLDQQILADSLACLQKTRVLSTRTVEQIGKSAEKLAKAEHLRVHRQ